MTITHLQSGVVTEPFMIEAPWQDDTTFDTIFHEILGRESGVPDVTLRPARTPTGSFTALFASEALARACRAQHRSPGTLRLDTNLTYVTTSVRLVQRETDGVWSVVVAYRAMSA